MERKTSVSKIYQVKSAHKYWTYYGNNNSLDLKWPPRFTLNKCAYEFKFPMITTKFDSELVNLRLYRPIEDLIQDVISISTGYRSPFLVKEEYPFFRPRIEGRLAIRKAQKEKEALKILKLPEDTDVDECQFYRLYGKWKDKIIYFKVWVFDEATTIKIFPDIFNQSESYVYSFNERLDINDMSSVIKPNKILKILGLNYQYYEAGIITGGFLRQDNEILDELKRPYWDELFYRYEFQGNKIVKRCIDKSRGLRKGFQTEFIFSSNEKDGVSDYISGLDYKLDSDAIRISSNGFSMEIFLTHYSASNIVMPYDINSFGENVA
jgi:hypothetical protein